MEPEKKKYTMMDREIMYANIICLTCQKMFNHLYQATDHHQETGHILQGETRYYITIGKRDHGC